MPHTPFFIVGAQRSGTTLLRLILNAHPLIAIPEEARFLMPLLHRRYLKKPLCGKQLEKTRRYISANKQFQNWNYDPKEFFAYIDNTGSVTAAELINQLYTSYAISEGKQFWADKSLFFRRIDLLAEMFPDACFVHLVRDGRDVFHSWRKMDVTKSNVAAIALDWNYKLYRINHSFAQLPAHRHITIRYEDLLASPEATIRQLCSYLDISFEPSMLDYHRTSRYYIGEHHSKLIFQSIDSTNRNKWRTTLSPQEIRIFEMLCRHNLRHYGYELSGTPFTAADAASLAARLLIGLPARAMQVVTRKFSAELALRRGAADMTSDAGLAPQSRKPNGDSN